MDRTEIIERRRKRNKEYWVKLMTKKYGNIFSKPQLERHIYDTFNQVSDLMLGYQEMGLEWWTTKNAKMAYYQTKTPILLVSQFDFLDELSKLVGKPLTSEDYTDLAKREAVYKLAQQVYERDYKPYEINELDERNI